MLVRTARRPDEEEVEKMVRDTMINIDRVGGSSAGGDAVLEAMVRGTGQEAFADATMLLSDVTVLTTKSEPPKDMSPEQKTSDSGAGAGGNNTGGFFGVGDWQRKTCGHAKVVRQGQLCKRLAPRSQKLLADSHRLVV